jgi:putative transposase
VIPGEPHHITQRGNRRQRTFFGDEDYAEYLALMAHWCERWAVQVWAWCLMPNHVHLIAAPETEEGLRRAIGEAHRRYTRRVNFREGWRGHLWQGRFASFVMDRDHLLTAARYIELNPVRAGLAARPEDYRWSSARAHLRGEDDLLTRAEPLLALAPDWSAHLAEEADETTLEALRRHERTGRPLGSEEFVVELEERLGRRLRPRPPGRKRKGK